MILFYDIFKKAVNLFDDPDLRFAYVNNPVSFARRMREYLLSGMHLFVSPTTIVDKLSIYDDEEGMREEIDGEETESYQLSTTPNENAVFSYKIGKEYVHASYDKETNTVTFERAIKSGETCTIEWYYPGAFTADFSNCLRSDLPIDVFLNYIINALAKSIACMWDEEEMNRALENRNILSDTDFKLYSPANSAKSKIEHHQQMLRELDTLLSELN